MPRYLPLAALPCLLSYQEALHLYGGLIQKCKIRIPVRRNFKRSQCGLSDEQIVALCRPFLTRLNFMHTKALIAASAAPKYAISDAVLSWHLS